MRYKLTEIFLASQGISSILEAYFRLRLTSFQKIRRWSTKPGRGNASREDVLVAFRRAASRTSGTCLVQAIALQHLLAKNGHASELRIGVARSGEMLQAHAWLVDPVGQTLVGAGQEALSFTVIARWGEDPEK